MADRIQLRRDTAANWAAVNPVLADGEIGLEQDTGQFKLGNGVSAYTALSYGGLQGPQGETGPSGSDANLTWGSILGTLADQTDLQAALEAKASIDAPSFTGPAHFAGAVAFASTLTEGEIALSGTTVTLDPALGTLQTHVLTGTTTYGDGVASGQSLTVMITANSSFTVTWPQITWLTNEGSAPTLSTTGVTAVVLWKIGTTLFGAAVGGVA